MGALEVASVRRCCIFHMEILINHHADQEGKRLVDERGKKRPTRLAHLQNASQLESWNGEGRSKN